MPFHEVCNPIFADRKEEGRSRAASKKIRHFSYGRRPRGCSARIYREDPFLKRFLFNFGQFMRYLRVK